MKDYTLLPKLIEASHAMDDVKKKFLLENIQSFDDMKKDALFEILKDEQDKRHDLNQRKQQEKKAYESKKGGIIRVYTERKSTESDEVELEKLEEELKLV